MTTKYASMRGPKIANTAHAIANRIPFDAGNLWAEVGTLTKSYKVYSYQTVVAKWTEATGWLLTAHRYSQTTGRHMTTIRRGLVDTQYHFTTDPLY